MRTGGPAVRAKGKQKTCRRRGCRAVFTPRNSLQTHCSYECHRIDAEKAVQKVRVAARKLKAADRRERRLKLKTRSDWLREAQRHFNQFVRLRDANEPCICCGRWTTDDGLLTGSRWDAGHYRSIGAAPQLRFNEDNCHKQRVRCNRERSGNVVDYRIRLVQKIGLARVEALESDNSIKRWTIEEIQAISAKYRKLVREMKKVSKLEASTP